MHPNAHTCLWCDLHQLQLVRVPLAEELVYQLPHYLPGGGVRLDNNVVEGLVALAHLRIHANHPTCTVAEVELGMLRGAFPGQFGGERALLVAKDMICTTHTHTRRLSREATGQNLTSYYNKTDITHAG